MDWAGEATLSAPPQLVKVTVLDSPFVVSVSLTGSTVGVAVSGASTVAAADGTGPEMTGTIEQAGGTTFYFTDYLSKVSPDWKSKVGSGTAVEWPVGVGAKGNEGVSGKVGQAKEFRDEWQVEIDRDLIRAASAYMKNELGYNLLLDITSVDFFGDEPRFEVIYEFCALGGPRRTAAGRRVDKGAPARLDFLAQAASVSGIHRHAGYDQRVRSG